MTKKIKKISSSAKPKETSLIAKIENLCDGLFYISETDAVIVPFTGEKTEAVNGGVVLRQTGTAGDTPVEEVDFDVFFDRLTRIQDWFGERETKRAKKFGELKKLLAENLSELKVFKVGRIRLDIYVVGLDRDGRLAGVKTKAVET